MALRLLCTLLLLSAFTSSSFSQLNRLNMLKNCQGEMRIATYLTPVKVLWKLVLDMADSRSYKLLELSPSYKLDTAWLQKQVGKVKQTLPANFKNDLMGMNGGGDWFDNKPDEPAIWFMNIFCQVDKNKNYKVYSAIRIDFEGKDATDDNARGNPKIKNIRFIFDKDQLNDLAKILKSSPRAGE